MLVFDYFFGENWSVEYIKTHLGKYSMPENFSSILAKYDSKNIILRMNDGKTIKGIMIEYDGIMNMTLDDAKDVSNEEPVIIGRTLIRGSNIMAIVLPEET